MFSKIKWLGTFLFLSMIVLALTTCDTGSGKYYTVSFNADGGEPAPASQKVLRGSLIAEPEEMTKEGYDFGSWYKDAECTLPWDFARDVVTEDITLYAKWAPSESKPTGGGGGGGGGTPTTPTAPVITTALLPDGAVGVLYSQNLAATGTAPITWSITGGSLPTGLTIAANGTISGTPTAAGTVTFTVMATNVAGNATRSLSMAIASATYTVTFNSNGGTAVGSFSGVSSGATIIAPTPPTKTGYDCKFAGWYKEAALTSLWVFASDTVTSNVDLYAKWEAYALGDTGPGGGTIFYVDPSGFPVEGYGTNGVDAGYFPGYTAYYLEAAPTDSGTAQWGSYGTEIIGVTTFTSLSSPLASEKGNGRKDTQIIVAYLTANPETGRAAQLCAAETFGGYNDWFLPSLGELDLLYQNRGAAGITGMDTNWYWSSSQYSTTNACFQLFNNGAQSNSGKNSTYSVRAVRAF